jgi:hypothetical protein
VMAVTVDSHSLGGDVTTLKLKPTSSVGLGCIDQLVSISNFCVSGTDSDGNAVLENALSNAALIDANGALEGISVQLNGSIGAGSGIVLCAGSCQEKGYQGNQGYQG